MAAIFNQVAFMNPWALTTNMAMTLNTDQPVNYTYSLHNGRPWCAVMTEPCQHERDTAFHRDGKRGSFIYRNTGRRSAP